jgi:hypothetical protein
LQLVDKVVCLQADVVCDFSHKHPINPSSLLLCWLLLLRQEVLRMSYEWAAMFDSYDAFQAAHPGGFYLSQFENITAAGQLERLQALAGILRALGIPSSGVTVASNSAADSTNKNKENHVPHNSDMTGLDKHTPQELQKLLMGYELDRLACAFEAAKHPAIFRPKDQAGIDAAFVYGGSLNEGLVCEVWRVVGGRAAQHRYAPYGGIVCPS